MTHFTVFLDPVLFGGFWYRDNSVLRRVKKTRNVINRILRPRLLQHGAGNICGNLNTPADADLRRCASVLFRYVENCGIAEDLTFGQWTVPFKHNPLLTTVIHKMFGLLKRMVLHLTGQTNHGVMTSYVDNYILVYNLTRKKNVVNISTVHLSHIF